MRHTTEFFAWQHQMFLLHAVLLLAVARFGCSQRTEAEMSSSLSCAGWTLLTPFSSLTAYYPSAPGNRLDGTLFADMRGAKLQTLQDFLDNRTAFVTVAMDADIRLPYGTAICVPALNQRYGRLVRLERRDTDADLTGQALGQLDICVRSEADSYEAAVNMRGVPIFARL